MGQILNFIEIGTSDFNTLLESSLDTHKGMSVEPLKFYLDNLPDKPNVQKVNAAIVDNNLVSSVDVYYIDPKIINEQGLGWWMKGCNSIEKPHPFHTRYLPYHGAESIRNLLEEGLVTKASTPTFTYERLLKEYDIDYVNHIKLDTEGQDAVILNSILDYYIFSNKQKPKSILFETTDHNDVQKSLEVCYRLISLGYTLEVGYADYENWEPFNGTILYDCLATLKTKANLYWDKWNYGPEERLGLHPSTPSKFIEYTNDPTDIAIFVDYDGSRNNLETIVKNSQQKYKVMVQMEPASFNRALHQWILENEHLFDLIFTHYPAWKGSGKYPEKYRYYIAGSRTFILPQDRKIYSKSKNITAIFSQKNFGLEGHNLRHSIRNTFTQNQPGIVDFNNPVEKVDGLKDYRYEIVVENEFPYFLTEKHLDSILSGCLPIIWGHPGTKQWEEFDTNGMLFFENETQLLNLIDSNVLTKEFYDSKIKSIKHNFKTAQKYLSFGDIMWNSGLKELI